MSQPIFENELADAAPRVTARRPAKPISVLHLFYTMAYGGIETVILNWLKHLDRDRFEPHLVCFALRSGAHEPFMEAARRIGIGVQTIAWSRRKPLIAASRSLVRLLRHHQVDILHTHDLYANLLGVISSRLVPVKTITTAYVWDDPGLKLRLMHYIDQYVMRFYDQVTAHCEATRRATLRRGFKEEEVKTLICGFETHRVELSPERRRELRAARGALDDNLVLVNVARLYPDKEQATLLRMFRRIVDRYPHARLWICGVGPLESELKALCHELGLDSRVRFLGFIVDLPTLLALTDIQVHPSSLEGVPLAICEGMASGRPIVATAVGGLPEVIHHDETGILVRYPDEPGFIEAVADLIDDPAKRARLGSNARHFVEHDYSLERAVSELQATYLRLVGAGRLNSVAEDPIASAEA